MDPGIGYYKLWLMMKRMFLQDWVPGRDAVLRLLRDRQLMQRRPKPRRTTNSNHRYRKYRNLIRGLVPTRPNELWVSDITYIDLVDGCCYLHLVTDAYSRSGEEARRVLAAGVPANMQNGEIEVSLYDQIWQAGTVLLSEVCSVGVMGDERTYENPVALRAVTSTDAMTADWAHLPYDFMAKISNEIINKVKGVNRVCYDISSKPPSTIEWE